MRKLLLFFLVGLIGIIFLSRLFYLQVINSSFATISESNAVKAEYVYPQRGFIYDRNGKLIVANQPTYDVMVIPREVVAFDTLEFISLLNISAEHLNRQLERAKIYSPRLPSVVVHQVSKSDYAYIQEKMRNFPGFYIQRRALRDYQTTGAANVLGYISQVNLGEIEANPYYEAGDLIGRSGIEKQYEELLRGVKGVNYYQRDRFSKIIGSYKDGIYDTLPVPGKDLMLTLDIELQEYGQKLMVGKRGSIVAIEPATGEILSLVTAPSYDPELLVGRERSVNYSRMEQDTFNMPLLDRSLLATYPPGSTFKPLSGLLALQEEVIMPNTTIGCSHGFYYGRGAHMSCGSHPGPTSIQGAVAYSCNTFFAKSYWWLVDKYKTPQEGVDVWKTHLNNFGLGDFLGYDLPTGKRGFIPDSEYYNRAYDYPKYRWSPTYILSNGIGQGEVSVTPIQLANITAAIANRGWYYTPHVLKQVDGEPIEMEKFTIPHDTGIKKEYFEPVIEGMHDVYKFGTAAGARIPDLDICGKTGTSENFTIIEGKRVQLTDHSIFIAFAPKENPKIAVAVFVENGRWGSRYAAKIASLMIGKYVKGEVDREDLEKWLLENTLEEEYAKETSGEPFKINQ